MSFSRAAEAHPDLRPHILAVVLHLACHPDIPSRLPLLTWTKLYAARFSMMQLRLPSMTALTDSESRAEAAVLAAIARDHAALTAFLEGPVGPPRTLALWCAHAIGFEVTAAAVTQDERLVQWIWEAQSAELSRERRNELSQTSGTKLVSLHSLLAPASNVFPDMFDVLPSMHPASRWAMLEALMGVESGVGADVVAARMIDVFLPDKVDTYEALPFEARYLIAGLLRRKTPWSQSQLRRKLVRAGLPGTLAATKDGLAKYGPVQFIVLLPEHYPSARAAAEEADVSFWRGCPFIFFSGDTSQLDTQIPEDAAQFTSEVMDTASKIASVLYAEVVHTQIPQLRTTDERGTMGMYRFYPHLSAATVSRLARGNQWREHHAEDVNLVPANELAALGWLDAQSWDEGGTQSTFARRETPTESGWVSQRAGVTTLGIGNAQSVDEFMMFEVAASPETLARALLGTELSFNNLGHVVRLLTQKGFEISVKLTRRLGLRFDRP
ncbi:MAG: hypothetical protein R3E66_24570 [bacterium]